MNALVSIDIATLTPATVFAPGGMEGIISKLEAEVRAIDRDISTPAGREAVKSLAYKVARSKTALDDMGKELVAGIKKQAGAIDADRKLARDRLDALKEEIRGPLTKWEENEANRVKAIEATLVCIIESPTILAGASPHSIRDRIAAVAEYTSRDWQEFKERADAAITETLSKLNTMLANAEQREKDAAELEALRAEAEALRAEKAAREEADRIEAYAKAQAQEREKAMERERQAQAERDRIAAEQAAERDRQHAERLEAMKREQEELAKRQAEEAAAKAVEDERRRVAAEEARKAAEKAAQEAAERKKQENKRHRERIHARISGALIQFLGDEEAKLVIEALAAGTIPHVSVQY